MRDLDEILDELAIRITDQRNRLTSLPNPAQFSYDRNGVRLGIAALEDETRELLAEWQDSKKELTHHVVADRIRHEVLDVAAVAMLIYENIPSAWETRET